MRRKAKFSGPFSFYPSDPYLLASFINSLTSSEIHKQSAISLICPHAGYIYSAKTAWKAIERVIIQDSVILIGPNHTGIGPACSIMSTGFWEIPGATIPIDVRLAEEILHHSQFAREDNSAHLNEHSLEVLLPMIFFVNPNVKIVPIVLRSYQTDYWKDLSNAIQSINQQARKPLLIASSDMSHFVSREVAKEKDTLAFQQIKKLDGPGLMEVVAKDKISMCGSGPVAVVLEYSKQMGAKEVTLVDYTDSGYITNDSQEVVSYASFIIT